MVVENNKTISNKEIIAKKKYSEKQLVVFSLENEEFGVDINQVNSIIKMEHITNVPNTLSFVEGVINLRGKIIVVINLSKKLGLRVKENNKNTRIIIIETKDQNNQETMVGMVVDHAREAIRLSENQIEPAPPLIRQKIKMDYLEGVGIINNRLLILLDLAKIIVDDEMDTIQNIKLSASNIVSSTNENNNDLNEEIIKNNKRVINNLSNFKKIIENKTDHYIDLDK
jgi:purine-binding chemotaxis protein CheW